ncbi:Similar to slc35e3: Solute carrier family 35 member E3 (Danio rerio) [Cotesia congregata]|uniref:Similar to slc35e3: Solute carrier family 35 member E3 (Danio rerio) n=1 Tax=Cotesia congregata TaxID=51543 RepID=A0A8J2HN88_COTCN|nr:Similar to slc35e3: Solute carrier family 35 member E3 (Danio rerio) [Cotesia congregata]
MNKRTTVLYLVLNVFFSILIVLLNKWVYYNIGFPNITLSMIHFIVTFIGLIICEKFDVFCIKDVAVKEMLFIAMTFCGFVVLTNLSLAHNTVGTYQIAKMLTTPCVIIIQMSFYNKHFGLPVKLTLIPIVLGVIINFYYDIQFNILGTIYATLGVLVTSLYQVWINQKQKELQMDPMQLLYYQAPLSALMLLFIVPIVEPVGSTLSHNWSIFDMVMVLFSSIVAFFVNLTSYWIIGKTSPLTYNMVGHCKFCLLLLGGSIVFKESLALNQAIGITLTLGGIISYTHMKDNQLTAESQIEEGKPFVHKI